MLLRIGSWSVLTREHSVLLDVYNLEMLSLHKTYGCEATGGNIQRIA